LYPYETDGFYENGQAMTFLRGFKPVPVADAALAFAKSVEGAQTGKTYRV